MKEEINIQKQAEYCLQCPTKPCQKGCPLQNDIPNFIKYLKEKDYPKAFEILSETTIFESICGRICPHQKQCQGNCVRGIKGKSVSIGKLEAYLGDYALENHLSVPIKRAKENALKVAIIGSGPAGLACAYDLSRRGNLVDIYEKHKQLGGLLRYGIPEFRLDRKLLDQWLKTYMDNENITVHTEAILGETIFLEDLKQKYDKIVLAFGANVSNKMHIPGEENPNVYGANELLEYQKMPNFQNKKVIVVGGGNVAMDTARTVKRLGAKDITVVYRRAEKQMPADTKELEDAKKEGIHFLLQTDITQIKSSKEKDTNLKMECIRMQLVQKEGETREVPLPIEGSQFELATDYIIMAIGSIPNAKVLDGLKLNKNEKNYLQTNAKYQTSDEKIYAIGDIIGTTKTVAWAIRTGFDCAKEISKYNK